MGGVGTSTGRPLRDGVRWLNRMERSSAGAAVAIPDGVVLRPYRPTRDHTAIPEVVADAFDGLRWPEDWERFPAFDPGGVFVAEAVEADEATGHLAGCAAGGLAVGDAGCGPKEGPVVGFVVGFRRGDLGYVSVLAVRPAFQRGGIGHALLGTAVGYLGSLGLERMQVDAFTDSPAAVGLYLAAGFEIVRTFRDEAGPTRAARAEEDGAA